MNEREKKEERREDRNTINNVIKVEHRPTIVVWMTQLSNGHPTNSPYTILVYIYTHKSDLDLDPDLDNHAHIPPPHEPIDWHTGLPDPRLGKPIIQCLFLYRLDW
jgi:hypothetical protein